MLTSYQEKLKRDIDGHAEDDQASIEESRITLECTDVANFGIEDLICVLAGG